MDTPNPKEAISRIQTLPTLPSLLMQILAVACDPDSSALDLGKYIAADQSLSAAMLRLVNSAYYGFYRRVKSVPEAIVILGFSEIRNLAFTATAHRLLRGTPTEYDRTQLWRHSVGAAMVAESCARLLRTPTEGSFAAGLLHDIGKVVLDWLYPDHFRAAIRKARTEGLFIRDIEREVFGMNHAEVGKCLAQHWNLPEAIVGAIHHHHDPDTPVPDPQLVHLTAVANFIAYEAGFGESSNGREPEVPENSVAALGISSEIRIRLIQELQASRDRIEELLGTFEGS